MADQSDIETALVSTVTQAAYPNGTAAASVVTQPCRIYRGWPSRHNLDADLKVGITHITVFPLDVEQNLTRYSTDWQTLTSPAVALTMTASGRTVTIGGSPTCPLNAAVLVAGKAYVYPLQATDTPTTIATALAALISADTSASNSGPVITVTGSKALTARIGVIGTVIQEVKRQKKSFRITIWCNDPLVRDAAIKAIDPYMSRMTFINLPDGSAGRIKYERSHTDDGAQKSLLYRRDLVFSVEYGTTISRKAPSIVSEQTNITGGLDTNNPPVTSIFT